MHVFYGDMPAERQQVPRAPERYEPLPPIIQLPGWVWRRLPRVARLALMAVPFVIVALILLLGPGIRESKQERSQSAEQRAAQHRADLVARLRAEQRPRLASSTSVAPASAPREERLAARATLLEQARVRIQSDARARARSGDLEGPIRRAECEPFPRAVAASGADRDLGRRFGRYQCLAVTAEFGGSAAQQASSIGHPYRMRIDFDTGRYAFCKISGRPGEQAISAKPLVTVPRACGGGG
jgi:hypothetical protein